MCMETEIKVNIEFSYNKLSGSKKQKCFDSSMILESKVFQLLQQLKLHIKKYVLLNYHS